MVPTAVVTGANSGIGEALTRLLESEGYRVIATDLEIGAPITNLGCESAKLDVSSQEDIEAFKQQMAGRPIDLLLNVAGIMYPHESDTLEKVTITKLQRTFAVNTFGPFLLTQALLPNVLKAPHPRIAVVSSRVGSIADNSTGGMYSYRSSKTAVNMLFKNLAVDLKDKNVPVILLHPGIVKSNLDKKWKEGGNENVKGAVEPDVAAADLWRTLSGKGMESSGKFWHRSGEELPW
ncbi:hypothetical protein EKO04_003473 [Ascochyta lentis]|uniref:NAD(P)-binding protein n=1 Tax=Ascochyta lentis TaxID=205686 RepID=A0A8H7JA65_9PLEO|nr:hypothetical protein EKO04_003473 [Ascochyta lentis]